MYSNFASDKNGLEFKWPKPRALAIMKVELARSISTESDARHEIKTECNPMSIQDRIHSLILDIYPLMPSLGASPFTVVGVSIEKLNVIAANLSSVKYSR